MDQIYSEASLTIIAGTGESDNDALPGVSDKPRIPQARVEIGDFKIVEVHPFPQPLLAISKWASRAWTYQEAFLSKRKLVFSRYQVWFICGGMYFQEQSVSTSAFTHSTISHRIVFC